MNAITQQVLDVLLKDLEARGAGSQAPQHGISLHTRRGCHSSARRCKHRQAKARSAKAILIQKMRCTMQPDWFTTPVIGARSPREITSLTSDPFLDDEEALFQDDTDGFERAPISKGARRSIESPQRLRPEDFPSFESYPAKGRRAPWQREQKLWLHTSHAFGYIPALPGRAELPIRPLSNIRPDFKLKRGRVNITLDRLRVRSYPGNGIHRILLHFYAQNQTEQTEDLHYNTVYRIREGEEAALRGYPLFIGLSVGLVGLRLRVRTINVSNDQDEALLTCLESDAVKAGLHLAATAQPAIAPFSQIAFNLAKVIGERHRNVAVQDFDLGLDFGTSALGARLAVGSYLAVQMPQDHLTQWNWQDWFYHAGSGLVLLRGDNRRALPYNYLVFSINDHE